jgi:hypothetical protein
MEYGRTKARAALYEDQAPTPLSMNFNMDVVIMILTYTFSGKDLKSETVLPCSSLHRRPRERTMTQNEAPARSTNSEPKHSMLLELEGLLD